MSTTGHAEPAAVPRLLLASASPYRRALLERLRLPFVWAAPEVDETPAPGEAPLALCRRLALAKATALAPRYPCHLIIGSDQVAVCDGVLHGKPGSAAAAIAQLTAAAGRRVRFLTALALLDSASGRSTLEVVPCDVVFRPLNAAQIAAYVAAEAPLDCAGSFKAEALGIALIERLECVDPTALTGLPLIALCGLLARAGLEVLTSAAAGVSPGGCSARGERAQETHAAAAQDPL